MSSRTANKPATREEIAAAMAAIARGEKNTGPRRPAWRGANAR